tara:strand:+ start:7728 stop:9500 length:1773 start_codon:yes stop_codon:yes gene_type:complete
MIRTLNIGTGAVYAFLALLLIISRIPFPASVPASVDVGIAIVFCLAVFQLSFGWQAVRTALVALAGFFVLLLVWAYGTSSLFSPGDDEYAYHLTAIWDLAAGWHPFFTAHDNIWVDSYPSGNWVLESYIVALTGLPLSGQSLKTGLAAVLAVQVYALCAEYFPIANIKWRHIWATLFALLVIGNPVVITQLLTHYTDAPVYLFGAGLVFFLMSDALNPDRLAKIGIFSCIILLVNVKTAALYYVPLLVFGGLVMEMVLHKSEPAFLRRVFGWVFSKGVAYGLIAIFATVVVGYKPYVTNLLDHQELLYPSVRDIMSYNFPANLIGKSTVEKFFYGIFGRTGQTFWPVVFDTPLQLKIPGSFYLSEFKALRFDTRRAGFGPMFSLAFITAILAYAGCKLASLKGGNTISTTAATRGDSIAALALLLLVISIFFPESWWARYVPFTWLSIVLFAAATLFYAADSKVGKSLSLLRWVAVISLLLCTLAATLGAGRQLLIVHRLTNAVLAQKDLPVIEFYVEEDPRIHLDRQSTTISDADEIWAKLFSLRGVNARVMSNGDRAEENPEVCDVYGYLEAHVFWCGYKAAQKPARN